MLDNGGTDEGYSDPIQNEAVGRLLGVPGVVCRAADRRYPHHQLCAEDPRGLGTQSADGALADQARGRLVAAEARGRSLSVRRGQLHAPALADHFCRVDFRPRRAWQSLPHVDLIRGSGSRDCIRAQKDPGYPPGRFCRQAAYPSPVGLIIGWSSERILSLPNRSGRCYPRLW